MSAVRFQRQEQETHEGWDFVSLDWNTGHEGDLWKNKGSWCQDSEFGLVLTLHLFVLSFIRYLLNICNMLNTAKCTGLGFKKVDFSLVVI